MASSASSSSLAPQLETLVRAFQQAKADARRLITGSSEGLLNKRPSPHNRSALECIAHLNLSSDAMRPGIRQAIEAAQRLPKAPASKYQMDLLGRLLAWSLEPPPRLKFKTASFAEPVAHESAQETLAQFERRQHELVELVHSAAGALNRPLQSEVSVCQHALQHVLRLWDPRRTQSPPPLASEECRREGG